MRSRAASMYRSAHADIAHVSQAVILHCLCCARASKEKRRLLLANLQHNIAHAPNLYLFWLHVHVSSPEGRRPGEHSHPRPRTSWPVCPPPYLGFCLACRLRQTTPGLACLLAAAGCDVTLETPATLGQSYMGHDQKQLSMGHDGEVQAYLYTYVCRAVLA